MDQHFPDSTPNSTTKLSSQNLSWPRRILQLIFIGVVLLIFFPFLIPLALSAVFASLLWDFMDYDWKWIEARAAKALILTTGFTTLILGPVFLLIGGGILAIQNKIREGAFSNIELDPDGLIRQTLSHPRILEIQQSLHLTDEQIRETFFSGLGRIQGMALEFLQSLLTSIPNAAIAFVIMVVCLYFLLKESRYIENFLLRYSPTKTPDTQRLMETFRGASISVVMAGIISGFAQATVIGVGTATTGLANPAITAMIAFVASFFPFLGTGVVSLSIIVLGLIKGDSSNVLLYLPFAAVSSIVDNVIYPVVVGSRAQLNPLVSFIAVIGGVQFFGLFGIFLGPIVVILSFQLIELITEGRISDIGKVPDETDSQNYGHRIERWMLRIRRILFKKNRRKAVK